MTYAERSLLMAVSDAILVYDRMRPVLGDDHAASLSNLARIVAKEWGKPRVDNSEGEEDDK